MPEQPVIQTQICNDFMIPAQQCAQHNKKYKLYCYTCKSLSCSKCVFFHNYHQIVTSESVIKEIYTNLKNIEYGILFYIARQNNESLQQLHNELLEEYNLLRDLSPSAMIPQGWKKQEIFYSRLQAICNEFNNIPLQYCKELCEYGRGLLNRLKMENLLHWLEWNEDTIHIFEAENFQRKTISFSSNFIAPFYCRTILLPYRRIFLCGGRIASGQRGLRKNYIISLEDIPVITELPEMSQGRSNHLVLYSNDNIYVIGGCDEANHYTDICEVFSLRLHKWDAIASLSEPKDTVGGCSSSNTNFLYIFGGRNTAMVRTVERYDTINNAWCVLGMTMPYNSGLHGVCLIPFQHKVIIFAGQESDGQSLVRYAEADLVNNTIVDLGVMNVKGGCVVDHPNIFNGLICAYMFEGYCLRSLVGYDKTNNIWSDLEYS